jgi:hypothetical protein
VDLYALGKRVEKLLLLAFPIGVLCVLSSVLMLASTTHHTRSEALQLHAVAEIIEKNRGDLEVMHAESRSTSKPIRYSDRRRITIDESHLRLFKYTPYYSEAVDAIRSALKQAFPSSRIRLDDILAEDKPPSKIVEIARQRVGTLEDRIDLGDLAIPATSKLTIFGMSVSVSTKLIASAGYFISCLSLLLWFGALRLTRRRELLSQLQSQGNKLPFPHFLNNLNVVLTGDPQHLTPRHSRWLRLAVKSTFVCLRTILVLLIAGITVIPLTYVVVSTISVENGFSGAGLLLSTAWYLVAIAIPALQLYALWAEEMQAIASLPIRVLLRGRDL